MDLSIIIRTSKECSDTASTIADITTMDGLTYEVLVIDDTFPSAGSINPTLVENKNVRYLRSTNPTPCRPGVACNEAVFYEAKGRYLFFLPAEDKLSHHVLRELVYRLELTPERGVGIAAVEPWDLLSSQDRTRERLHFIVARETLRNTHSRLTLVSRLLFFPPIVVSGAYVIRRNLFLEIGGFDPELALFEDVDLIIRAIRRQGFVYVDDVVNHKRTRVSYNGSYGEPSPHLINTCYRSLYRTYKKLYGRSEYYGLKILSSALHRARLS